MSRHVRIRWVALALLLTLVFIAGCGSKPATPPPSQPAAQSAPPAAVPTAPAKPKELVPVSIGQSQDILSFAPLYVARAKGYFEEEGIKLTVEVLAGGAQTIQALSGDSVQLATTSAPDLLNAVLKKQDYLAVQNMIYQTMGIAVNKAWADKKGVSRSSPFDQRLQALKGAIIGSTGPGAASETYPKWLVANYGKMDPKKDLEIIAIGGLPARQAALKSGQINAYVSSGPGPEEAEAQGFGYVLIPASDVPANKGMLHEIVFGKRAWIEKNPEVVAKVAKAITRGGKFLVENPAEGKQAVAKYFAKIDAKVLSQSIDNILGQVVKEGTFEQKQWDFLLGFLRDTGALKPEETTETTEGKFWTNKYVK